MAVVQAKKNLNGEHLLVRKSFPLNGRVKVLGAKNAVLVSMAALIMTKGVSKLTNVPFSSDILAMSELFLMLGARVEMSKLDMSITIDTRDIKSIGIDAGMMRRTRASILIMGSMLSRFGNVKVSLPGGCLIGKRPIDFHLRGFSRLGVSISETNGNIEAKATIDSESRLSCKIVLEYPSVGATENLLMFATSLNQTTKIVNAALEPEVLCHIDLLRKMGAQIDVEVPNCIVVQGGKALHPVEHEIIPDRLEAGLFLVAASVTGGTLAVDGARASDMDVFVEKLREMGHEVVDAADGITIAADPDPRAVNFKTAPYPGFPTDLQSTMMCAQCVASGESIVEETVFENRLMHVRELKKMGAQISVSGNIARIKGVRRLYGTEVIATDIRAACALVIAGCVARGVTTVQGIEYLERAHYQIEKRLQQLGCNIERVGTQVREEAALL
ncbi:UDP-N-acetylglucosamine 1-carboxyvinyltransferase [bacterium]|nr:UDP-N-acetylglucosamine 1-carboxyvinyltransferase [bacterium]